MIPDYQTLMLPLLKLAGDGSEHRFRDPVENLANQFELTEEERTELLPSGTQSVFHSRVGWARTYLKQAGLLESPRRGFFRISESGRALVHSAPEGIDNSTPLAPAHRFCNSLPGLAQAREERRSSILSSLAPIAPEDGSG